MSASVPTAEEFAALAARVAELEQTLAAATLVEPSPYLTIPEAAKWLRTTRKAVDDLLSAGKLARHKRGSRTLIARTDLEAFVQREPGRRG